MPPSVDVVIDFQVPKAKDKAKARETAVKAEQQYQSLVKTLRDGGLRVVGKSGRKSGTVLLCVSCPQDVLVPIWRRQRLSDFLTGMPLASLNDQQWFTQTSDVASLPSAERARLISTYISHPYSHGGLGVVPESEAWSFVAAIVPLQDKDFNTQHIPSWSTNPLAKIPLERIRQQFGETTALYFDFLKTYTLALIVPTIVGFGYWYLSVNHSISYPIFLLLWQTAFAEYWRQHERVVSQKWSTEGSRLVEPPRHGFTDQQGRIGREIRSSTAIPIVATFTFLLSFLVAVVFLLEGFLAHLYAGPGHKYAGLIAASTIAAVPISLAIYRLFIVKHILKLENHKTQSSYESSLIRKTFPLSAVVAYMMLIFNAFVYAPFAPSIMQTSHSVLSTLITPPLLHPNSTLENPIVDANITTSSFLAPSAAIAIEKLNKSRTKDQLFAYTFTNQIVTTLVAVFGPYLIVFVIRLFTKTPKQKIDPKKTDLSEGEREELFLEDLRSEVAKSEPNLFNDYLELVVQFGYVALWSPVYTLVPLAALLNNAIKLRADLVKIVQHNRRSIPSRSESIGAWLDCITALTWIGALTNAASIYLWHPTEDPIREHLIKAAFIGLAASHAYIILQSFIKHLMIKFIWSTSESAKRKEATANVKELYLKSLVNGPSSETQVAAVTPSAAFSAFWAGDQGLSEIKRDIKED